MISSLPEHKQPKKLANAEIDNEKLTGSRQEEKD